MTGINILALSGIGITELEIYEQTDSGGGWVAFRVRKSKAFTPCPACGSVECRTNDYRRKPYRFRSQTGIEVPGFGRLNNSLSEGFNNKVKTLKKACYGLSNFKHLRKRIFLIFDKSDHRK